MMAFGRYYGEKKASNCERSNLASWHHTFPPQLITITDEKLQYL